jgi:hypothetical protein
VVLSEADATQVRSGFAGFAPATVRPGFEALVEAQMSDPDGDRRPAQLD